MKGEFMATITSGLLKVIINDQREERATSGYISRTIEDRFHDLSINPEIIIFTGMRRVGKSVVLQRLKSLQTEKDYCLNFEDDRLTGFTVDDFQILYETLVELFGIQKIFYFDEIQNINGWERFVRRLYNQGNKIYITGSNANLFSDELGTKLTGRYIAAQIHPISFKEYVQAKDSGLAITHELSSTKIGIIKKIFAMYCQCGGIPEYIKYQQSDYIHALYNSIIYRDIIERYKISNGAVIKKLVFYLASNCSQEITYNSLRKILGIGSVTTVSAYCSYLESSYLCFFLQRYSDSVKVQLQAPKKVYFSDHVLAKTVGFRISEDFGRLLENIVFVELKRRNFEIFYYKDKVECDFIVRVNNRTEQAIQVCKEFSSTQTAQREIDGLTIAMQAFSLDYGLIITEHDEKVIFVQNFKIIVLPIWKWLLGENCFNLLK